MLVLRCSSEAKSIGELIKAAEQLGNILLISPAAARTKKELEAAFAMAREAFAKKSNLSPKLQNEAMLFLACETNFSSAIRKVGAASPDDFVLACERKIPLSKLKTALKLVSAQKLALPEWGKKKGKYTQAELAIEKMALSRIKN
jgi:tRNA threonylcarbamoyladenosine modification (KEOPS) complex Cgi121 subunit